MKNVIISLVTAFLFVACVDDFQEYNTNRPLDAPVLSVRTTGPNQMLVEVPVNAYQTTPVVYSLYEPVQFAVDIIKAKGLVASASVASTILEFGTVTLDESSVGNITGKEAGSFNFTFVPNPALPDMTDRTVNVNVSVTDAQDADGEGTPVMTTVTIPIILTTGCFSTTLAPGSYAVIGASGNLDGGVAYTHEALVTDVGEVPVVTVTMIRPGLYRFDEVTGGVWPTYYPGRAKPSLQLDLCNKTLSGHLGGSTAGSGATTRRFTLDGMINDDNTITVNWSYALVNGGTPGSPAQGSYVLKRIGL